MILDNTLVFSDKQEISSAGESTNVIDNGAAGDVLSGLWFVVTAPEDAAGDVTVNLETSETEDFAEKTTLFSRYLSAEELTEGSAPVKVGLPAGVKRYLRVNYTAPTGAVTLSAFLTANPELK